MNGLMGLQSLMLNPAKVPSNGGQTGATKGAEGAAISFQKFLKQQQGLGVNVSQERKPMSVEEMKLLKNSFVFLTELKLRLSKSTEVAGPFSPLNKKLKDLLEEMGENMEFVALLPDHLQEVLTDYLQQMNGSFDPKAIKDLTAQWDQFKKEKATPVIGEVNDLLNAIKTRLNQAGVQVDVEEKGNQAKVVFTEGKEGKLPVASKSLLNRISKFLNKTDDMPEKIALKTETLELREGLRKHLSRDQQSVGWHKDEIIHKAQNATLRHLEVGQQEGAAKQQISALTMEKLIKEEAKGIEITQPTSEKEEENSTTIKKVDQSMGIMLNSDSEQPQTKMVKEAQRGQGFFYLQPEEIISQMVEKFRLQVRDGASQMEIQLHPEELGRLKLSLSIEEGVVTARLLTGNIHVKELIEQSLPQLRESFAKDGLRWDEITVDVSQDDLGGNAFSSQGQEMEQRRNRSRRGRNLDGLTDDEFGLGGVAGLEEAEDKRDPDRLVDYMA